MAWPGAFCRAAHAHLQEQVEPEPVTHPEREPPFEYLFGIVAVLLQYV